MIRFQKFRFPKTHSIHTPLIKSCAGSGLFLLKPLINTFVFPIFRVRLFSVHHSTILSASFLYGSLSYPVIHPFTVVMHYYADSCKKEQMEHTENHCFLCDLGETCFSLMQKKAGLFTSVNWPLLKRYSTLKNTCSLQLSKLEEAIFTSTNQSCASKKYF